MIRLLSYVATFRPTSPSPSLALIFFPSVISLLFFFFLPARKPSNGNRRHTCTGFMFGNIQQRTSTPSASITPWSSGRSPPPSQRAAAPPYTLPHGLIQGTPPIRGSSRPSPIPRCSAASSRALVTIVLAAIADLLFALSVGVPFVVLHVRLVRVCDDLELHPTREEERRTRTSRGSWWISRMATLRAVGRRATPWPRRPSPNS